MAKDPESRRNMDIYSQADCPDCYLHYKQNFAKNCLPKTRQLLVNKVPEYHHHHQNSQDPSLSLVFLNNNNNNNNNNNKNNKIETKSDKYNYASYHGKIVGINIAQDELLLLPSQFGEQQQQQMISCDGAKEDNQQAKANCYSLINWHWHQEQKHKLKLKPKGEQKQKHKYNHKHKHKQQQQQQKQQFELYIKCCANGSSNNHSNTTIDQYNDNHEKPHSELNPTSQLAAPTPPAKLIEPIGRQSLHRHRPVLSTLPINWCFNSNERKINLRGEDTLASKETLEEANNINGNKSQQLKANHHYHNHIAKETINNKFGCANRCSQVNRVKQTKECSSLYHQNSDSIHCNVAHRRCQFLSLNHNTTQHNQKPQYNNYDFGVKTLFPINVISTSNGSKNKNNSGSISNNNNNNSNSNKINQKHEHKLLPLHQFNQTGNINAQELFIRPLNNNKSKSVTCLITEASDLNEQLFLNDYVSFTAHSSSSNSIANLFRDTRQSSIVEIDLVKDFQVNYIRSSSVNRHHHNHHYQHQYQHEQQQQQEHQEQQEQKEQQLKTNEIKNLSSSLSTSINNLLSSQSVLLSSPKSWPSTLSSLDINHKLKTSTTIETKSLESLVSIFIELGQREKLNSKTKQLTNCQVEKTFKVMEILQQQNLNINKNHIDNNNNNSLTNNDLIEDYLSNPKVYPNNTLIIDLNKCHKNITNFWTNPQSATSKTVTAALNNFKNCWPLLSGRRRFENNDNIINNDEYKLTQEPQLVLPYQYQHNNHNIHHHHHQQQQQQYSDIPESQIQEQKKVNLSDKSLKNQSKSKYKFNIPEVLLRTNPKLKSDEYDKALSVLTSDIRYQLHLLLYRRVQLIWTLLSTVICIMIPLIIFANLESLIIAMACILWLGLQTIGYVVTKQFRKKLDEMLEKSVAQVNTFFMDHNLMLGVINFGNLLSGTKLAIPMLYFDTTHCREQIESIISIDSQKSDADGNNYILDYSKIDLPLTKPYAMALAQSQMAKKIVLRFSQRWISYFEKRKLLFTDDCVKSRHLSTGKCLCQFIEEHFKNVPNSSDKSQKSKLSSIAVRNSFANTEPTLVINGKQSELQQPSTNRDQFNRVLG